MSEIGILDQMTGILSRRQLHVSIFAIVYIFRLSIYAALPEMGCLKPGRVGTTGQATEAPLIKNAKPLQPTKPSRAAEARPRHRMRLIRTGRSCTETRPLAFIQSNSNRKRYAKLCPNNDDQEYYPLSPPFPALNDQSIRWWLTRRRRRRRGHSRTTGQFSCASPTRPWRRSCA